MPLKFFDIKKDKSFEVTAGILGRESQSQDFSQDIKISRKHLEFTIKKGRVYIKDLNSSNGTFVNGENLVPEKFYEIEINDVIEIGNKMLKLIEITEGDKKSDDEAITDESNPAFEVEETETIRMSEKDRTLLREDLSQKIDEMNKEFKLHKKK